MIQYETSIRNSSIVAEYACEEQKTVWSSLIFYTYGILMHIAYILDEIYILCCSNRENPHNELPRERSEEGGSGGWSRSALLPVSVETHLI